MAAGMIGRNRKPTAQKIAEGNLGGNKIRTDEPKPMLLDSVAPPKDYLHSVFAQKIWRKLAPELRQAKIIAQTDILSFAALCNAAAEFFTLDRRVALVWQDEKRTHEMGGGKGKAFSPLVAARNAAAEQFKYWTVQFGMTPAAVARLIAIDVQTDWMDEFADQSEEALQAKIEAKAEKLGVVVEFDPRRQDRA